MMDNKEYIVTGTQAKKADRYAIDVLKIPSLSLMEAASAYVFRYLKENCHDKRILIVCGTGNNGGDGICIAGMLLKEGMNADLVICGDLARTTWEFSSQLSAYQTLGGSYSLFRANDPLPAADILVDALFGIGLNRPVTSPVHLSLIRKMADMNAWKVAVDIPSGINADTGESMGACVYVRETFTFGRNKTGLTQGEGKAAAGHVHVCDIGIPDYCYGH